MLQRFYGGDYKIWISMPAKFFRAYTTMLPALRASESLRAYDIALFASGNVAKGSRGFVKSELRHWQRDANRNVPKRKTSMKELEMRATVMGIPIVRVKKKIK